MVSRNRFSLTFVLASVCVLLLAVMTPATRAECDCDKPEEEQKERHGVSKFFHNTLCGVKGAARSVSNTVKDGYHYVKNKLSSSKSEHDSTRTEFIPEETTYHVDLRFGGNTEPTVNLANR